MQQRNPLASLTEPFEPHNEPAPNRQPAYSKMEQQPHKLQLLERMKYEVQHGAEDAFYVVDLNSVVERVRLWKTLLPEVTPFYAVKCNPDAMLLSTLAVHGVNFDCASRAEIQSVLDLGVSSDRIIYANPCKQPSHVRFAADKGVNLTVADSESELHKMAAARPGSELLLRIAVDDSQAQCVMSCKYGAPVNAVPALLRTAAELGLRVRGVSFHVGSGCYSPNAFAQAVERAAQVFEIAEQFTPMDILDIGGGFPGRDTDDLSFADIAAALRPALTKHFPPERGVALIAEPGRFFVAQSHVLAVSIIGKKSAPAAANDAGPHTMYFVNDGLYGSFNCILYDHTQPQPQVLPSGGGATARPAAAASVWGPTCDGLDCIAANTTLPELHEGEWLYFEDMGAYTAAAGSTFNGMPLPDKVYVPLQCASGVL